jgi:hypothetical protein
MSAEHRKGRRNPPFFEIGTVPAILCSSGGRAAGDQEGNFEMTTTSNVSQRLFAMVAAFGMTTFMLVASFSAPSAHAVQLMFA